MRRTLWARRATSTSDEQSPGTTSPLRLISDAARGNRRGLVYITVAAAAGGFFEAVVLLMIARLAVALASHDMAVTGSIGPFGSVSVSVPVFLAVAAGLTVLRVVLQLVQSSLIARTLATVWTSMRTRIMLAYVGASWSMQADERGGRMQELVTTYATNAAVAVLSLAQGLVALVSLLAFLVTAFVVNLLAAFVVLAAGVIVATLLLPLRKLVRQRSRASSAANMQYATETTEFLANLQEVRVFNVEDHVTGRILARTREVSDLDRRARFLTQVAPALYQGLALLLVVGAIGSVYASGATGLSSLGGIVLIMVRSLSYGQQLQTSYHSLYSSAPYFELLSEDEARYKRSAVTRDGVTVERIRDLTFDHVVYEYDAGRPVLHDLSFDIRGGEFIGIIGPSGSGKSTLVQLVLRLREPTTGAVLANGSDARSISMDSWYRRVSFVPQEPKFFAGSVADNIRFYRSDIDDAAVERAAKLANLHDEIESMTSGYDTLVGERGGKISGGQRQRLSIARALAEDPDILVLDEPTSSLDVRSEALIRESLSQLPDHTMVLIIAHRLSTLKICNRIMVIYDGKLQGFDAPDRLEAVNPFYQEALRLSGLR